jgi:tetratricopeptide (TPR) repeat protein
VRHELGELFYNLSLFEPAVDQFGRAAKLLAQTPDLDKPGSISAQYGLVRGLVAQSKLDRAATELDGADASFRSLGSQGFPQVKLDAARARVPYLLMRQRYAEAVTAASDAVSLTDELKSSDFSARFSARRMLSEAFLKSGEYSAAARVIDEMATSPFAPESVGEVLFARREMQLAQLRQAQGLSAESEAPLLLAREAVIRRLGPNEYSLSRIEELLGISYMAQGKFTLATRAYGEAYRICSETLGQEHQCTRVNALNLALVGLDDGRPFQALEALDRDRPWFVRNMGGAKSPVVQLVDFFRVRAMLDMGMVAPAGAILPLLKPSIMSQVTPSPSWDAIFRAESGRVLVLSGRRREGEEMLRLAVQELEKASAKSWETGRYKKLLAAAK